MGIIMKTLIFLTFTAIIGIALAEEVKKSEEPEYVGVEKCKRCHQRDHIYQAWTKTAHADSWDYLDEKQKKDEECIACHATGETPDGELLVNVQCEACHGPGSQHKRLFLADSKEKAKNKNITYIGEETCLKCHDNKKIPEQFRPDKPFDYTKAKEIGIHSLDGVLMHEILEH